MDDPLAVHEVCCQQELLHDHLEIFFFEYSFLINLLLQCTSFLVFQNQVNTSQRFVDLVQFDSVATLVEFPLHLYLKKKLLN